MRPTTLFLVEDDDSLREVLTFHLREAGHEVHPFERAAAALEAYSPQVDVVLTDLRMPGMDGLELLERLRERDEQAVVLILTAYGGAQRAVEAMRRGAFHYVEKPVNTTTLLASVDKAVEHRRELQPRGDASARDSQSQPIVASSPKMNAVLKLVDKIADSTATVLLRGESGTGKELIARAIHGRSRRGARPFVAVNCAAIPEELLESTLFGHERGAFTGASRAAPGKFRQADGGTLFLDEIAELSPHLQSKLLRVLQEGEVEVVGAARPVRVDTRVIAATHQDLEALMQTGALRQDLYYRLNVVPIEIPPLRQRPEDIPALTRFFLRKLSPDVRVTVSREVDRRLLAYHWPGNVRELQNVIERMVLLRDGDTLGAEALPGFIQAPASAETTRRLPFALPEEGLDLMALERAIIEAALEKMGGNRSATARYLQIPRHVLLYRLEKYGIS
jgi:two-component system NtrC family response regulator